jgi:membrane protease subunit HflK
VAEASAFDFALITTSLLSDRSDMAWNEPGGNPGKRNPWGSNKPEQGPPDLDEVIRNLQRRLSGCSAAVLAVAAPVAAHRGGFGLGTILLALATIWAFTGPVPGGRCGARHHPALRPARRHDAAGLHWHMPWPIETKQIVNTAAIDSFTEQTRMLTSDENLVDINMEVQYPAANALDFAFNVYKPEEHAQRSERGARFAR